MYPWNPKSQQRRQKEGIIVILNWPNFECLIRIDQDCSQDNFKELRSLFSSPRTIQDSDLMQFGYSGRLFLLQIAKSTGLHLLVPKIQNSIRNGIVKNF